MHKRWAVKAYLSLSSMPPWIVKRYWRKASAQRAVARLTDLKYSHSSATYRSQHQGYIYYVGHTWDN